MNGNGLLAVGVGEHDLRRLAAEFEHAFDVPLRRRLLHDRADFGRAGEGDHVDAGMRGQRRAGFLAEARDDIDRARAECPASSRDRREQDRRHAGFLGGLQHDRVAGGERRRERAAEHLRRIVPRQDMRGHAIGLARDQGLEAAHEGHDLAVQLVGGAAVIFEIAGRQRQRRRAPAPSACRCRAPRPARVPRRARRSARPSSSSMRPRSVAVMRAPCALIGGARGATAASMSAAHRRAGSCHRSRRSTGSTTGRVSPELRLAPFAADEQLLHGATPSSCREDPNQGVSTTRPTMRPAFRSSSVCCRLC